METPHSLHSSVHAMSSTSRKNSPSSQAAGSLREQNTVNATHTATGLIYIKIVQCMVIQLIVQHCMSLQLFV